MQGLPLGDYLKSELFDCRDAMEIHRVRRRKLKALALKTERRARRARETLVEWRAGLIGDNERWSMAYRREAQLLVLSQRIDTELQQHLTALESLQELHSELLRRIHFTEDHAIA